MLCGRRQSAGGTATGLRAGRFAVRMPVGARDFSLLGLVQTYLVSHPTDTAVLCWR